MSVDIVICIWLYADLGAVTSSPHDPESVLLNPMSSEDILLKVR